MSLRAQSVWSGVLLLASGCIDGLIVDVQHVEINARDGAPEDEDGGVRGNDPDPADASEPREPPQLDAGAVVPRPDAGHDAGSGSERDAGRDAGAGPDAGGADGGNGPDAGCTGPRCDAGTPPGPCNTCNVATLIAMACDNGMPKECWTEPDGTCSMQCPEPLCSKDQPDACGSTGYCFFPRNDCGAASRGYCATRPPKQNDTSIEVCGCDGARYKNLSYARNEGTDYQLADKSCF